MGKGREKPWRSPNLSRSAFYLWAKMTQMKNLSLFWLALLFLQSCAFRPGTFTPTSVPSAPDYSKAEYWAALPAVDDMADRTPQGYADGQMAALADVFFLHPTTYLGKGSTWNAPLESEKINRKTDETAILYQASIFNGAGRVFAPRYRQAHLKSFYTDDKPAAKEALDLAYHDIKRAFQYYLDHENGGRPIIIASHSQGALHAIKLLKDFFDGKELQQRLVVAYVVGWPVLKEEFESLQPCESPDQTGCICSWRTFKYGYMPPKYPTGDSILVTNPLTWTTDSAFAPKEKNLGAVLKDFDKIYFRLVDAQVHDGLLWAHKPKFPGSFLFTRKNYHIADLNFYYLNVRENAEYRASSFLK